MQNKMYLGYCQCPLGIVEIEATKKALVSVKIFSADSLMNNDEIKENAIIKKAKKQLDEYFANKRKVFDLLLHFDGSEFQQKVWNELAKIPFGKTVTYGQLAKNLGSIELTRAVGNANSKNPFWIIIPCHRVVGSNGELTGYAGGLWRKQWLLEHESNQYTLF
jgi:methylated-DNA-[protein]-cysteine S-methyltransferase